MDLMIIEGAGKVAKISSFVNALGIEVFATKGHIRELDPKVNDGYGFSFFGSDAFIPHWSILGLGTPQSKWNLVQKMQELANKANKIYIATDPDREGEAIAYHVYELLKNNQEKAVRITFNAINKTDILNAIDHPRSIDMNLVNSAIARAEIDKYLGYKLSNLVQRTIQLKQLSAGRVQSVALKMVADREKEIAEYKPTYWWTYEPTIDFHSYKLKLKFNASESVDDEESECSLDRKFNSFEDAVSFSKQLTDKYELVDVQVNDASLSKPPKPLTTSDFLTLASKKFKMDAETTQKALQVLYEKGLTTYPRTDSTRISQECCNEFYRYVLGNFGNEYADGSFWFNKLKQKEGVQDGHECLRVAHLDIDSLEKFKKEGGDENLYKLYQVIWTRSIVAFVKPAVFKKTTIHFNNAGFVFTNESKSLMFDGFMKFTKSSSNEEDNSIDINLIQNSMHQLFSPIYDDEPIIKHSDSCPKRFDTGTLIKMLEKAGVGRPSTYATMSQINIDKHNVDLINDNNNKVMKINEKGNTLNNLLQECVPNIINEKFTASFEKDLDLISENKENWLKVVKDYAGQLENILEALSKQELEKFKMNRPQVVGTCPKCGGNVLKRKTKDNKEFLVCENYKYDPNTKTVSGCSYIKFGDEPQVVGKCPKCGKNLILKKTKDNKEYKVCEDYHYDANTKTVSGCSYIEFMDNNKVVGKCPKCGGDLLEKKATNGNKYKVCKNRKYDAVTKQTSGCDFIEFEENKKFKK